MMGEFCIVAKKESGGMVGSTVRNLVGDMTAEVIGLAMSGRERWGQRDKMVRTEYRTLEELVLFGKLFQLICVYCVKVSVNMNKCMDYLSKKKENHAREMMCKNK